MMITRRRLLTATGASLLTSGAWARAGARRLSGGKAGTPGITRVIFGTLWKYNNPGGTPPRWIISDVFAPTWASDDNMYSSNDDSLDWQGSGAAGTGANVQISKLTPGTTGNLIADYTTGLVGSNVSLMAPWGLCCSTSGSDGNSTKGWGPVSVNGTLYVNVSRQGDLIGGVQYESNAQIIKATVASLASVNNAASNWTPQPDSPAGSPNQVYSTPMFPGSVNDNALTISFIQYGKDYGPFPGMTGMPDGADTYVYALTNNGCWNNGYYIHLGRVPITAIGNLNATDWEWYRGDGLGSPGPWGAFKVSGAVPTALISNPAKTGTGNAQYLPAWKSYVHFQWYYTSLSPYDSSSTHWDVYVAPQPWGPWKIVGSADWNAAPGKGLYNPAIFPKSVVHDGGINVMLVTSGDWSNLSTGPTGDHGLMTIPVTFNGVTA